MQMETKNSHDLPAANWRTMKASGIIQFESKGLSTGSSEVPGWEEMKESRNKVFLCLFHSIKVFEIGWYLPSLVGVDLFYLVY